MFKSLTRLTGLRPGWTHFSLEVKEWDRGRFSIRVIFRFISLFFNDKIIVYSFDASEREGIFKNQNVGEEMIRLKIQCDQSGQFLKSLGWQFPSKSSQNLWWLGKNYHGSFLGNFWKNLGNSLFQHLVTMFEITNWWLDQLESPNVKCSVFVIYWDSFDNNYLIHKGQCVSVCVSVCSL